jgi:uncharacterized protein YgbK (DUF1537 family)
VRPAWVLAKGGITATDVAFHGLGVSVATVLGQVALGVSAWRCGPDSRFPGLLYVVFPGNVGDAQTLRSVCAGLLGFDEVAGGEASERPDSSRRVADMHDRG